VRVELPRRLRANASGREGFSIIEVLIAMIILSVGLLALQAMAIGAVQRTSAANRQMAYPLMATEYLERDLTAIRTGAAAPVSRNPVREDGVPVAITVTPQSMGTRTAFQIEVEVTPPADGRFPLRPVTVVGSALR
jgi:prepilin-type N-terminal cleavage/methylation domain-containing protein